MKKISKTVNINAPVEKVFAYMENPAHLPEIWPSILEVSNILDEGDGKKSYDWVYKMAGMKFNGHSETLEYIPNKRIVVNNPKGIESKFTWDYKQEGNGTRINLNAEYVIPVPLLGKLAEAAVTKQGDNEADELLANLKKIMEA